MNTNAKWNYLHLPYGIVYTIKLMTMELQHKFQPCVKIAELMSIESMQGEWSYT